METIKEEHKEQIIKHLHGRKALVPCSRCGSGELVLEDGYFNLVIQSNPRNISIQDGSPAIPLIAIVCINCGAVYLHTLLALNVLSGDGGETLEKE